MRKHAWLLTNLVLTAALVGAGYFVVVFRQDIQDWWALRSYTPSANIVAIADETAMIGYGRDMFYVSQPKVEDSEAFNLHCTHTGEKTVVLGCYAAQKIYLYNVTDVRLDGVVEVTAAHEMLHAVYERMDEAEKAKVDAMIEAELPKVTDERLRGLIALYAETEPGEKLNEMHSILGTEYPSLSPELEAYYKQYFGDRTKVVALAQKYQGAFAASQARIADMSGRLQGLKAKIDANTGEINRQKAEIEAESERLNNLRNSDTTSYNAAVPGYNAKTRTYNNLVLATRQLIEEYNQLVIEHNNEAAAQSSLYRSLDSQPQTVN